MQPLFDPVTLVNLILCFVIVILSIIGYVKIRSTTPLFIGAAFFLFGVSHVATLLGLITALGTALIIVRALGYVTVCVGVYLIIREIMLRMKTEEELKTERLGLARRVDERTTELQRANEALRDSQARLQRAESVAHFGNWELNLAERKIRASAGASVIYGLPGEEWSLADVQGLPLPEYRVMLDAALTNLIEHQRPYNVEYRIRRPGDGQLRDIHTMAEYDAAQRVVFGAINDITERKQAEEALIASEVRYRRLFEAAKDGILILDADTGLVTDVNPFLIKLLGYSHAAFLGKKIWELGFFKDTAANKINFRELQQQDYIRYEDLPLETADGRRIDVEFVSNAYQVNHHKVIQCNIRDITARKQAEKALRESEEKHRRLIENSHDIIYTLTAEGIFTFVSPAWTALLGHPVDRVVGQPFQQFVHPDDLPECMVFLQKVTETGQRQEGVEYRVRHLDGSWRWHTSSAVALRDEAGMVIGGEGTARDITESKQAEEELKANRRQLTDIIEFLPDATAAIDQEKRVIIWNKAIEDMTGVPAAEMIGQGDYACTIPFYGEARPSLMDLVFEDQTEIAARYPTITREGDTLMAEAFCNALYHETGAWVFAKASPLHDQAGNVIGAIESIRDITARKRTGDALRETNAYLESLINYANAPIIVWDPYFRITRFNHAFEFLTGYTEAEVIGQSLEILFPPALAEDAMALIRKTLTGERWETVEIAILPRDESTRTVLWNSATLFAPDGQTAIATIAQGQDITARKQAEEALRESEKKYRRLVDNANEAILVAQDDRLKFVNHMAIDLTGYSEQELLSTPFHEFIHPADRGMVVERYRRRLQGDVSQSKYTFRLMTREGSARWVEIGTVLIDWAGRPAALSFISDITDRKRAEAALRESNAELQIRNEELDVFAHMVAHDLKNPLGAMMGYAELLTETYDALSTEMIQKALNSISRIGRKAGNIIESLFVLASVRKQDVQVAPLNMAHIVDEAVLRLADSVQDSGADIHVSDRADWPVALGHAPWIEEIWVNYLSNALKYGGQRPRIDLVAARLPPLSATGEGQGGGFIRFSVRDYGAGLTPEQQQRLFAPFERLGQAQVEGYGLGLSVVRHIAEKLGGQVGVDSAPGQGSTFYFTLPAAPDPTP